MIKKIALTQLIAAIASTLLFVLTNGMAQTGNDEIKSIYFDNIVRLTVEALNDRDINVAYCEVPVSPYLHGEQEILSDSAGVTRFREPLIQGVLRISIRELLRGGVNIDSLIILRHPLGVHTGSIQTQYPLIYLCPRSKWIIFFDSPYLRIRDDHDNAMAKLKEYEEKLRGQVDLNANNYFTVYEDGAAFCTYFPGDEKYPPMFIYSEGLVDDFRTIIELQENPSLLSESSDSYENYYNSLKEELARRVFSRLFVSVAFGQDADLKVCFEFEYRAWKEYVEEHSFSSAPGYNEHMSEIVKMGIPALPLIIQKMEKHEYGMDFLLEIAVYLISRKRFEKEDWPEGTLGDSHTAAAMYIDWWHNGLKDTRNSFNRYFQEWERDLADKNEEGAEAKLLSIKKLGIAAIPFMIEKIKEGDLQFIKIISDHTNGSLIENASKDECVNWWNENKDKYTIVNGQ